MTLDSPLGQWLPVKRHVWFPCYRSPTCLYHRDEEGIIRELVEKEIKGFYERNGIMESLPLDSHPINHQQIGQTIWSHHHHSLEPGEPEVNHPPGHLMDNTITSDPEVAKLGSDGWLYLHKQKAAAAWLIRAIPGGQVKATILLAGDTNRDECNSFSLYRYELEGMYRGLLHIDFLDLAPASISQTCNNEQAVINCDRPLDKIRDMIMCDSDILLAMHQLKRQSPYQVTLHHIYGHQDSCNTIRRTQMRPTAVS